MSNVAMCGTGSDSKAEIHDVRAMPIRDDGEVKGWGVLTCEKLQRMRPLKRIREKEVW
jgi:hypothetical protein